MTQSDFSMLPMSLQTNLLVGASLAEALRYWAPPDGDTTDVEQLEAVVWATIAGCTRMFEAGERDEAGEASFKRLIAAVPADWARPRAAESTDY